MPFRRRLPGLFALILIGTLVGCGDEEHICDICGLSVRVVGNVRSSDGAPVPNPLVRMTPLYGTDCCGTETGLDTVRVATNASGVFDGTVVGMSIAGPDRVEVRIDALPADELTPVVDTLAAAFAVPWETPPVLRPVFVLSRLKRLPLRELGP